MAAYDIRIYKSWSVRNMKAAWVNTYVVNFEGLITDDALAQKLDAIATAERTLHLATVQFLHATVSTKADEPVYDPKTLKVFELQGNGGRAVVAPDIPVDLNIVLKVKKQVAYGRAGTMFYRGALLNSDVSINDRGEAQLKADASITNPVIWNNFNSGINQAAPGVELVMADHRVDDPNAGAIEARNIQGFSPAGVVINKRDHRYFDRKNVIAVP